MTRSPAWPNGGWPRSWPSAMASVSSSLQPQHLGDAARDLRDLERVRQPRAVVIAGRREEDLGLVLQPPERLAVDDAIAIALERRAGSDPRSRARSRPAAVGALGGLRARGSRARAASSCSRIDGMNGRLRSSLSQDLARGSSCRAPAAPTPKSSAIVWPRSANVARVPRSTPGRTPRRRRAAPARARASDRCSASSDRCRDRR